jgi:hypothetical protein
MKGSKVIVIVGKAADVVGTVSVATCVTAICLSICKNDRLPIFVKMLGYGCAWILGMGISELWDDKLTNVIYTAEAETKLCEMRDEDDSRKD